ncbi:MAG: VC_2705 family sodium/solute symporter [Ignavibacteriae bacterium]|nr:cation acetate symporter [Ignavibacteriota bacterium]NOG96373.1 VC_2705 family sodium/solute symporter [Ignavibacteriota bacterium]
MNRYVKFLLYFSLLFFVSNSLFAQSATQLEGEFKIGPAIILICLLITFVMVGIFNRAKDTSTYWAAGRKISPVGAGMAIASNWMSAASFLGMAAVMYGAGYHGLSYVVGWTGGYVLLLILMAGQIRRYGKYTAADFIGDRFYSKGLRGFGAGLAIFISFSYCVGQFAGIGLMFKWILGIDYSWAVLIGASVVLTYTLISGMLGVTKNMQIQYVIIIISFVIPLFILCYKFGYFPFLPQVGYGAVVSDIVNGIAPGKGITAMGHDFAILPSPEFAMPWDPATGQTAFQWIAICFSLMIGTAGLPHVIQRFYVVPRAHDARWSVVWGLFFICILYWSAPVYSAFGKVLSANPEVGKLAKDAIVVYTAQLGDLFPLIIGLLAAGAVSAAFSTVSGLLVAGASAFSHDLYFKVINPEATEKKQMLMARVGTILMAAGVSLVALLNLGLIAQLVAVAFSLAGCTIFPLFLLGIWWSGSNRTGAWAGLFAGGGISLIALVYFVVGKYGGTLPAQDIINYYLNAWYFAWLGAPFAIIVNIIASKLSKNKTPIEIKKFLAEKVHNYKPNDR